MILDSANKRFSKDTTVDDIRQALEDVSGRGEFLILSKSPSEFIQIAGEGEGPFLMEYKEANLVHKAKSEASLEAVEKAFTSYFNQDGEYKQMFDWEVAEIKPWWKLW